MSDETSRPAEYIPGTFREISGWRGWLQQGENVVLALALGAMMMLPLIEIVCRKFSLPGISGGGAILQHFTLLIGMLGGAVAAREGRLLALSTAGNFLKGPAKIAAAIFSGAFGAMIAVFLCAASLDFVRTEREAGKILAYGLPIWVVQMALPLGFGCVAARLLWHSADQWRWRGLAILAACALVGFGLKPPLPAAQLVVPALFALLVATALGSPVFATLGGAALILFWGADVPIAAIPLTHYSLVTNPTLPAIPLFTLAGYFLAEGGASKRLVRVFQTLFGQLRGGPAIVTALVCAFFTSFTGASGVTILALGGLLMPVLLAARYTERSALGLLTGAGSLGLLFPPCLPLILYSIVANSNSKGGGVTMEKMFLGGFGPGVLLVALTAWWGIRQGPKLEQTGRFDRREAWAAILEAKWELLLPVVALVTLFGGFATSVEAAAVTAFYAFLIETFVYRDLKLTRDIRRVMTECGLLVGGVLLILGVALGFTNYLVDAEVPAKGVEWVTSAIHSKYTFLLVLNIFLLVVGCLMDIYSAIVVVVPLLIPLGNAFGIDPIHLGIIFLANMELGFLTPPVGMNLFLASYRFNKPMGEVTRSVVPMLLVLLVGVLLITYIPALTTALPGLLK